MLKIDATPVRDDKTGYVRCDSVKQNRATNEQRIERASMAKVDLNITDISGGAANAYQTRVKIEGVEYSKSFNWNKYGSKEKALNAARRFRNKIYKEHGIAKPKLTNGVYRRTHNSIKYKDDATTDVVGVQRICRVDDRRPQYGAVISYAATWRDRWDKGTTSNPRPRQKMFYCGYEDEVTEEMEDAAFEAACDFRYKYEQALKKNKKFVVTSRWDKWRETYAPDLEWPTKTK